MTNNPFEGLLSDFLLDARERIDRIEEILLALQEVEPNAVQKSLDEAKRELHTIKGNSGMMGLNNLRGIAHDLEEEVQSLDIRTLDVQKILIGLDQFRVVLETVKGASDSTQEHEAAIPSDGTAIGSNITQRSIRVPFTALDELVDLLAEMVIFRNRLADAIAIGRNMESSDNAWDEVDNSQVALYKTLTFIQERIMRLRMVPLRTLFVHLRRLVHDEAIKEGKEINFETSGGDTPMDKALLEVASEALGHLVRNAVIHGIELPDYRLHKGKTGTGRIYLSAATHANEVQIDVEDDGAGISRKNLLDSASKYGIDVSGTDDLYSLLFLPGFTTKHGADLSAGRGMGLSAAIQSIQRLGGRIETASEEGIGSRFRIHLPLSVSITRAMLLSTDNEVYALPVANIVESLHFHPAHRHFVNHAQVLNWRDIVIPLLDIGYSFGTAIKPREKGYVVVIEADGKYRGLLIDEIMGIREIVVKGLDTLVGTPQGISGSTILGDGHVVLILDPSGLSIVKPFVEETV